jgi:hypothetical protein
MNTEDARHQHRMELRRLSQLGRETARTITLQESTVDEVVELTNHTFESADHAQAYWDGLSDQLRKDKRSLEHSEFDKSFGQVTLDSSRCDL